MRSRLSHLTLILEIPKFKRYIKMNRNIKSVQVFSISNLVTLKLLEYK